MCELSKKTKKDIEIARKEFKEGKFHTLEEIKKKLKKSNKTPKCDYE